MRRVGSDFLGLRNIRTVPALLLVCLVLSVFPAESSFAELPKSENYELGNVNFGQQMFLTTIDYSAPTILGAGPEVIELTPYTAKIKWFTDKNTSSSIFYGTGSGIHSEEVSKAYDSVTTHEVELTGLQPKTTYFFIAKSRDTNGSVAQSEEKQFTTPLPVPEVQNLQIKDITENSAMVVFNTSYYATSVVEYVNVESLEKATAGETGFSKDHSIALQNLKDNKSYSCIVIARDDEGQQSQSASINFTTLRDSRAPKIDSVKFDLNVISGKNKVRATIAWKTDEDSTSQIKYKESNSDTYIDSTELIDVVKNHFITLPDLKPQTTYKMIAVSKDKSDNIAQSEEFVILTPKQKRTFLQIILENIQQIFEPFSKLFE